MLHTGIPSGWDSFCPLAYLKRSDTWPCTPRAATTVSAGHVVAPARVHGRHERRHCGAHTRTVDALPHDYELLAGDAGCGAHARTVDALPRDRELLAGTNAREEEPSADMAADEKVEREGAALAAVVSTEHYRHLVEATEDAAAADKIRRGVDGDVAVGDELRHGTWMTKDVAVGDELRRGTTQPPATSSDVVWTVEDAAVGDELRRGAWMTEDAAAADELRRGVDGRGCGRRRRALQNRMIPDRYHPIPVKYQDLIPRKYHPLCGKNRMILDRYHLIPHKYHLIRCRIV
uniref:Uncharacterized protein n=1 Tax=Oryza glumipatula TaxID=40148 RepID=A0A0D9Z911_9ORYZ